MRRITYLFGTLVAVGLIALGCDSVIEPAAENTYGLTADAQVASNGECLETGVEELTAHYINDLPDGPIDVTCDVGVFFDEDGTASNVEISGTVDGAKSEQFGVFVYGADVDVLDSEFDVEDEFPDQFLSIAYRDGATGTAEGNTLTGAHRVGILLWGEGTDALVRNNTVEGIGPKDDGWAGNGIQVSNGATGTLSDNIVKNHWWDMNDFLSSGIFISGNDVTVSGNAVEDNDLGIAILGNNNNAIHNTIEVTEENDADEETLHYGAHIFGKNNGVRQSTITAEDGSAGIYIYSGSVNTKLIRNDIDGWTQDLVDGGDDTKRPSPFTD